MAAFPALLAALVARSKADPDLWGHIEFGRAILREGRIPSVDSYSFTADRTWVNHEWLSEVTFAGLYDAGGSAGLLMLTAAFCVSVLLLVHRVLRTAGVRTPARIGLLFLAFATLGSQLAVVRPQAYSVLLFAVLVWLLHSAERGQPQLLVLAWPVFTLWANLHGGWIVGLGLFVLWAAAGVGRGAVSVRWGLVGIASAAAGTMVNPYGVGLWEFLWETVHVGRDDIGEWASLLRFPSRWLMWATGSAVMLCAWRRRRDAGWLVFIPPAILGVLSLKVARLEAFYLLAVIALLAPLLGALGPSQLRLSRSPSRADLAVVAIPLLVGTAFAGHSAARSMDCMPLMSDLAPEPEAVSFFKQNHLQGRLLTWFDYGEYAIWHLTPSLRVSYDGRRETVYSDTVRLRHLAFYFSSRDASYANRLGADYVWLPRRLPVVAPLQRDGWVPVFTGTKSVVLARAAGHYEQPPPFSGARCFPGP